MGAHQDTPAREEHPSLKLGGMDTFNNGPVYRYRYSSMITSLMYSIESHLALHYYGTTQREVLPGYESISSHACG